MSQEDHPESLGRRLEDDSRRLAEHLGQAARQHGPRDREGDERHECRPAGGQVEPAQREHLAGHDRAEDAAEVEGAAGGGLVKVRATAKGTILGVSIDESLLQPSEKSMVEDLIAAAINDARAKADQAANSEMQKVRSGLPLPPGMKLPF